MAAPERFAEMSDSSCTAGAVHTWHLSGMALTIWLTRNWTATALIAKVIELEAPIAIP